MLAVSNFSPFSSYLSIWASCSLASSLSSHSSNFGCLQFFTVFIISFHLGQLFLSIFTFFPFLKFCSKLLCPLSISDCF